MDKRRIKIAMKVLHEVKEHFSETKEFIDDCIEQERLKENITLEEVIFFFYTPRSKKLAQRNIFYFVVLGLKAEMFLLHLTKYINLNSLSHDICMRVTWI